MTLTLLPKSQRGQKLDAILPVFVFDSQGTSSVEIRPYTHFTWVDVKTTVLTLTSKSRFHLSERSEHALAFSGSSFDRALKTLSKI